MFLPFHKFTAALVLAAGLLLADAATVGHCSGKPVAYFGVNLRFDPIEMYERYQPMMDYLSSATSYEFHLKISHDYAEGVKHLAEGKTQIASLGDGAVIGAILKHGAIPIVKPLNQEGRARYRSFFIVPAASRARSLSDLKGKRIALGYHHSITGNLIPRRMLSREGIDHKGAVSLVNLPNHTAVAKGVIKGEYEAGAAKDVVARRWAKRGLRIIATSDELPSTPIVASAGAPPKLVREVTNALVALNRLDPQDRKVLANWDEEYKNGFARASAADYGAIARMYRSVPFGCAAGCHR